MSSVTSNTPESDAPSCSPIGWQQSGFPSQQTYQFPNIVNVEIFRGACPCSCIHCPVGKELPGMRSERFGIKGINFVLFEKIAQEVAAHPWSTLRLHSVGDPVVWDGLREVLEITRKHQPRSWLFTSAVTSDKALLKEICVNTDVVEVSINSIDSEDYRKTKGVDAYELVEENIHYMSMLRNSHNVRLIASRTQTNHPDSDQAFVKFWKSTGLVDDAFVRSYHNYNGLLDNSADDLTKATPQPCLVHWARFNISVDGLAVICFNELFRKELNNELVLGNISRETILDVWHGERLSALRKAELTANYNALPYENSLPCKKCISCQPLNGTHQTSEYQIGKLPTQ